MMNDKFYKTLVLFAALFFFSGQNTRAQKGERKILTAADVPATAQRIEDFVPKDWKIVAQADGDLNGDKAADAVLSVAFDDNSTALIVIFKTVNGGFTRAAVAPNALHCDCGSMLGSGAPEVKIERRQIILQGFSGSRDIREITMRFRFEASTENFLLIGDDYQTTDRLELKTRIISSNYLTNRQIMTEWIEDQKKPRKQKKIKPQRVYLDELDYQDYWEKFEKR